MTLNRIATVSVAVFTLGAAAMTAMTPAQAQGVRGDGFYGREGFGGDFVYGGIGIGRAAFPIPGAIPVGTPYDPYRLPYTYDWPYGYGYTAR